MSYTVTGNAQKIDFGAVGVEEVLQNVRTILATPKYSVPLHRDWFIDYSLLDAPIEIAKAKLRAEILSAVRDYEPRAEILEIKFLENEIDIANGRLIPKVVLEVNLSGNA